MECVLSMFSRLMNMPVEYLPEIVIWKKGVQDTLVYVHQIILNHHHIYVEGLLVLVTLKKNVTE